MKVKLQEIIDGMEMQTDDHHHYFDKKTGQLVLMGDEEFRAAEDEEPPEHYPQWQQESIQLAAEIIEDEERFIQLPSRFEIHEWDIMDRFVHSLGSKQISNQLFAVLRGSGAFRRFREAVYRLDLQEKWFEFRQKAFRSIAIEWCELNDLKHDGDG